MPQKDCGACGKPIEEGASFAINAFGSVWHKGCFNCAQCGERIFSFAKFFDNGEGKPKCAVCFKKKAPTCGICKKTIEGQFREAHDQTYHDDCFRCCKCNKKFEKGGSFEDEGKLYHLECFSG
mmetsp:Transcript_125537/g.187494  ORF Transcript_125537/g.187494 Transcript_125537/m.187494 type:complete len:123 (-) Transcript_125537:24-392(-)